MQEVHEYATEYIPTYKGLIVEKLLSLPTMLEVREADLLLEIIRLYNSKTLNWISVGVKKFVWINYGTLLSKFNGLHYSMKMLQKDLSKLERLDLIDRQEEYENGQKRIYFCITKKTEEITLFYCVTNLSHPNTPQGT